MDEVIDDIISMQSSYDDIQAYIDPIQMPNTVSPYFLMICLIDGTRPLCSQRLREEFPNLQLYEKWHDPIWIPISVCFYNMQLALTDLALLWHTFIDNRNIHA
jgi:hypothetical protein